MGRSVVIVPQNLSAKLRRIRESLQLSQTQLPNELGAPDLLQSYIAGWELGTKVPPMYIILRYARLANVCAEVLMDDEIDLPEKIPAKKTYHPH